MPVGDRIEHEMREDAERERAHRLSCQRTDRRANGSVNRQKHII